MRENAIDSATSPWSPPQAFEEYRLVCPLSRGAMGEVYLAHDTLLDRPVAIKFIIAMGLSGPSQEVREQFLTEARAAARLSHPNVVTIYRVSEIDKRPLIISEFVRGQNLDGLKKPVPWQKVLELGLGLARGLAAAHRRGVLHLDIKPGNVIVSNDGEVKLLDFGLARLLDLSHGAAPSTTSSAVSRTPTTPPKPMAATVEFTRDQAKKLMSSPMAKNLARSVAETERSNENHLPVKLDVPASADPAATPVASGSGEEYPASEDAVSVSLELNKLYLAAADLDPPTDPIIEQSAVLTSTLSGAVTNEMPARRPAGSAGAADADGRESDPGRISVGGLLTSNSMRRVSASALDSAQFQALDWGLPPSTEKSRIAGTPLYMAPEIWRGEPGTRRADIYSMGALLYELLFGVPPFADVQLADLPKTVNGQDAPPLLSVAPGVDPRLAAIVDRCLRRDPALRFGSGDELREALEQVRVKDQAGALPEGNPYRGLLAFEAEHRALFFGRRSEIGTIADRLRTEPLVLVAADSGVGKSSLCRAGVLPLVVEGALGKGRQWATIAMVPGRTPLTALCAELSPHVSRTDADLVSRLTRDPSSLTRLLHRSLGDTRGLLLFIDQLEEMVTIADPAQSRIVGEALGHLCARIPGVRMLMTVRSDFLARVAAVGGLGDELVRALYILRPLTPDKIQEAIIGPAQMKGVSFESTELVETLVASTAKTDGGLPLLQFALTELWEARRGDSITKAALDAIGGVAGALARHADQVMLALPVDQRKEARRILMALVTMEGTRARRSDEEIARTAPARQALEALVRARLVVARDTGEGAAYEVAHEALLKGWEALRKWLEEHSERRAAKQRLETAAAEWSRLGSRREALWSKLQLADAELLEDADITPRQAEFLSASRKNQQRMLQLRRSVAILIPCLLVSLYSGYRIKLSRDLSHRVELHLHSGQQLRQQAQRLNAEVEELRKKAFAAFDGQRKDEGEASWEKVLTLSQDLDDLYGHASQEFETALTLDSSRDVVRLELRDVLFDRALVAERDHAPGKLRDLLARMELYDIDGQRRRQWSAPAVLALTSNPAGAQVKASRYEENKQKRHRLILAAEQSLGSTPLQGVALPPGSYLLTVSAPNRVEVRYPVLVRRGERLQLNIDLPAVTAVPPNYVYIPAGRFLFGTLGDELVRRNFLTTVPLHEVATGSYLIARNETTFAEWITFLESLTPEERTRRTEHTARGGMSGSVGLKLTPEGVWQLSLQPVASFYTLRSGERLVYAGRKTHVTHDWLRTPASGVSRDDTLAYTAWLDRTGKVPGARLCSDYEWERAARGADDRTYPHGYEIDGTEANLDESYGRDNKLAGPDEIGSHPSSQSPFGLDDLAGNVFEWVTSSLDANEAVLRGGGFFYTAVTAYSHNRSIVGPEMRDPALGFRVCAPAPAPAP